MNLLNTSCSYTAFHLFQDRTVNREKEKGGVLDFDGEDARKAAQSTRVLADVMDEVADSGDSLDFLGGLIYIHTPHRRYKVLITGQGVSVNLVRLGITDSVSEEESCPSSEAMTRCNTP